MNNALSLFKLLADDTRLKLLRALSEKDMYVELLAERLQLSAPTVSFHMKKLQEAGLVDVRREQYYSVFSLRRDAFEVSLSALVFEPGDDSAAERLREEMYRRKVVRSFMPDGVCRTMPAQQKKRMIIFDEIFSRFTPGASYSEREVNRIIGEVHEDFCTVRRAFVGLGWMSRKDGIYTVNPEPDHSNPEGFKI